MDTTHHTRHSDTTHHSTEPPFRLHAIMRQGTAASVDGVSSSYRTLEQARQSAQRVQKDDRVLRVFIVRDEVPPRFVEWLER